MSVLKWDGTAMRIEFQTLSTRAQNIPTGAWTIAKLLRKNLNTTQWQGQNYLINSARTEQQAGWSFNAANQVQFDTLHGGNSNGTDVYTNLTDTFIFAISKAAGSAVPEVSVKNLTTGAAWVHTTTGIAAVGNGLAAGIMKVGDWVSSDYANEWMGLDAWWDVALTQAQKAELSVNKQTSDWWGNSAGSPAICVEYNVAVGSLVDLAANASTVVGFGSGPTLDAAVTLENWNFNGKGIAVPDVMQYAYAKMRPLGSY